MIHSLTSDSIIPLVPQKGNHEVGKAINMQMEYLRIMQQLGASNHDTHSFM